jgi:uncharacterized protein YodC (DUF2158 family)
MLTIKNRASIATALILGIALGIPWSVQAYSASSDTATQAETARPLRPGDLVRLRSGGTLMTVDSIKGNQAVCFWTDVDGQPNEDSFPIDVLEKF